MGKTTFSGPVKVGAGSSGRTDPTLHLVSGVPNNEVSNMIITSVANAAAADTLTLTNASMGQATTLTIPDPGAATANFMLDHGTTAAKTITALTATTATIGTTTGNLVGNVTGQVTGGITGVASAATSTITAAAGATNTSTITIQLKDNAGNNITSPQEFVVYSSSASNGLTRASAASTGYSVASGGMSMSNGTAVTTQITAMSSATGACTLSLLDTGKLTSYLVLVLYDGIKISAQLTSGSYG